MVMAREGASLLPTSSCSEKNVKADEERFPIIKKRALFWLKMTTFAFIFCWLSLLTCRSSFQPETAPVLTLDAMHQLMTSQEVRG